MISHYCTKVWNCGEKKFLWDWFLKKGCDDAVDVGHRPLCDLEHGMTGGLKICRNKLDCFSISNILNLGLYGECTTSHRTNCPQTFCEKIFYLYVSFLSLFAIKIVSQKLVILHGLSQKLVTGFFPTQQSVLWQTPSSFFLQCSHTHTFSFSVSLAVCLFPLLSVRV